MPKINQIIGVILEETKRAKDKTKKKKKKNKSKQIAENNSTTSEMQSEEQNNMSDDAESEDDNDEDVCSVSNVSNLSSDTDSICLQIDGIMKTAPEINEYDEGKVEIIENVFAEPPQVTEGEVINLRALQQYAKTYELENFDKNYLIIFNQKNIINYEPRIGTDKDAEALINTLSKFKFECHEYVDLTRDEIMEILKIFEREDFTEYGCVAVAVLTHGNKSGLLRAKDREYSEMEIINYFKTHNKPTLVTKPKLLIIQACRGLRLTPAVPVMRSHMRFDRDVEVEPYTLPVESDMLILHSSYIGCPSIRSEIDGSWFIQTLCKKIVELSEELDIESILTEVKREVAVDLHYDLYNRVTYEVDIYKQMPVVTSTLIRKLYLKPNQDQITLTDDTLETYLDCSQTQRSSQSEITSILRFGGQCSCYLEHFTYIKNCLSYFVSENPDDKVAQSYLDISNSYSDNIEFNAPKEIMAKAICNHLRMNATNNEYYKYIYMHKH